MIRSVGELRDAYHLGDIPLSNKLIIDNDSTSVYDAEGNCIFEMHPQDLLEQALDALGIPYEPA